MNEIFEMKEYAKENSVPILKDGTRDFIIEYIKMHNIKKIHQQKLLLLKTWPIKHQEKLSINSI